MNIGPKDLEAAVKSGIITEEQAKLLDDFWYKEHVDTPSFRLVHLLYYFGGLMAISAVTYFVTQSWEHLLGFPLFIISILLFVLGISFTHFFLKRNLQIPAGIMATFALAVVPLAVYNLQHSLGYYPYQYTASYYSDYHRFIDWYWVPMELATLIVGIILFYVYEFPFLFFIISATLWYLSMDLAQLLFRVSIYEFVPAANFTMYFGLGILAFAFYMDIKHSTEKKDNAFWLYLFGVMAFWGGLSSHPSSTELAAFLYCMINVLLLLISVYLDRRVFAVFGSIGVLAYLSHLARIVFPDSYFFPIVLAFLGILIILAASQLAKVERKLENWMKPYLPHELLKRR